MACILFAALLKVKMKAKGNITMQTKVIEATEWHLYHLLHHPGPL